MTLKSIAEFMKIEGHKGRKGADFNARLVKRILDKENFIGDITITAVLRAWESMNRYFHRK